MLTHLPNPLCLLHPSSDNLLSQVVQVEQLRERAGDLHRTGRRACALESTKYDFQAMQYRFRAETDDITYQDALVWGQLRQPILKELEVGV